MSDRSPEIAQAAERLAYRHRLEVFLASRDAGGALTADALADGATLQTLVGAAAAVADYTDVALAITQEEYRPQLACREGCAYCCRKPGVLVTVPELLRLLVHVHATYADRDRSALTARARRYAAQIDGRSFNDPTAESVPCPLLVNERCTAYEVRPLVCRGYNSTSMPACRTAHDNPAAMVPLFAILKDVTDGATVGMAQASTAAGMSATMVDLGTALHIALSAGEAAPESIAADPAPLRPAMHATWVTELWNGVRETAHDVGMPLGAETSHHDDDD